MKRRNFFLGLTAAVVGAALELRLAVAPAPAAPRWCIDDLLRQEAQHISEDLQKRIGGESPWVALCPPRTPGLETTLLTNYTK